MKQILLGLTALAFSYSAQAQLEIRPFVGMNLTDVSKTPDGTNSRAKLGGQIGTSVMIGNKLHFMPGIAYFSQSTEYSNTGSTDLNFDQNVKGVSIPLLVGYRFFDVQEDPFFNVRLFAGPALQFLTTTERSGTVQNEEVDWSSNTWSAMLGLGFDINFVFLDLGYSWGLSDIGKPAQNLNTFESFRTNTFFLNLGVRLNLAG